MTTHIKICGIMDVQTAAAAWEQGADYLGVVMTASRRQVTLEQACDLVQRLPQARFVAVGSNVSEAMFAELLDLPFYALQLHGPTPLEWVERAHRREKRAIATQLDLMADIVLLDSPKPGSGSAWDWHKPDFPRPIWLAGGLTPGNVGSLVSRWRPEGVDVSSGVEINGKKDLTLIRTFIQEVHHGDDACA